MVLTLAWAVHLRKACPGGPVPDTFPDLPIRIRSLVVELDGLGVHADVGLLVGELEKALRRQFADQMRYDLAGLGDEGQRTVIATMHRRFLRLVGLLRGLHRELPSFKGQLRAFVAALRHGQQERPLPRLDPDLVTNVRPSRVAVDDIELPLPVAA